MLRGIGAGVVPTATSADVALCHVRRCRVLAGGAAVRFPGLHIAGTRFVRAFLSGLLDNHCYLRLKGRAIDSLQSRCQLLLIHRHEISKS